MSRLRKSGRKINGYSQPKYVNKFNDGFAVRVVGAGAVKRMTEKVNELRESQAAATKAAKDKVTASPSDRPVDEIDDKKMNYGREEIDSFFQRKKLAEEQAAFDAKKKEEEDIEADEAEKAETARENKSQGKEIAESSDGGKGSFGARRGAKKDAKRTAKEEKRGKIDICNTKSGRDKRQCKKGARKDFRKDKKSIRKENRKKFASNTKKKIKKIGKKLFCTKKRRRKGKC
jgi:hypothetical protein